MTNADKIRAMTDEELAHFMEDLPNACPPITESELLYACRYAIGMILKDGSVEYLRVCGGKWHRTSWFDVVDEIDNRLSKIEAEGGGEDGDE